MLEKMRGEIYKCLRCGWCREKVMGNTDRVCPARELLGFESSFGRGRVLLARGILEKQFDYDDKLVERMYTCLGCGGCKTHCPLEVDTVEIFRAMREDAVRKGVPLPEPLAKTNAVIGEYKNPFGKPPAARDEIAKELNLPATGDIFYFGGCYDTLRYKENFVHTVGILRRLGVTPAYLGAEEWCCGVPQIWDGCPDQARELAIHNVEALRAAGAKLVITSCAGCFNAIGHYYRGLVGELPFKIMHITEYLAEEAKSGRLKLKNLEDKYPGGVTYHDPCHLGRHMGVYDEPRLLLRQMFPTTFKEMPRNRENAWCCGGGAVVFPYLTDYSLKIAAGRAEEAADTGVGMIVTTCPSCISVLKKPARQKRLAVKDLLELIAEAIE